jgi:hypothetical protein
MGDHRHHIGVGIAVSHSPYGRMAAVLEGRAGVVLKWKVMKAKNGLLDLCNIFGLINSRWQF